METEIFDPGWRDSPHRVVRNSTYSKWEEAGRPPSGQRPGEGEQISPFPNGEPLYRYSVAAPWKTMEDNWEASPLYAGATVELIHDLKSVAEIVDEIEVTAEAALERTIGYRIDR
ncbi:MAG TPA: hypothetical protein VMJ11_31375 [Paraburkholderia sp.]|uniref:hypothetical protein n=1 Tax=Paraburkholderia sp. TaxID=1926495 RepID=UPI002C13FB23|nr:hypothetical protein [Paraburkholderia sp.]HTR11077.1 hypothetical protein [Paraburkholderia sp.]